MRRKGSVTLQSKSRDARQRAWSSMRWLGTFTLPDIIATAEIGDSNVRNYLKALEKARYVKKMKERRSGYLAGNCVWQLVKNTGPIKPIVRIDGTLYDQNLKEVISYDGLDRNPKGSVQAAVIPGQGC